MKFKGEGEWTHRRSLDKWLLQVTDKIPAGTRPLLEGVVRRDLRRETGTGGSSSARQRHTQAQAGDADRDGYRRSGGAGICKVIETEERLTARRADLYANSPAGCARFAGGKEVGR